MLYLKIDVVFMTREPIEQNAASELWKTSSNFKRTGRNTYLLTTHVRSVNVDSGLDLVRVLLAEIENAVNANLEEDRRSSIMVIRLTARLERGR